MQARKIEPIAVIYTDFEEKFGIPRQSGRVPSLTGRIVFEKPYRNPDALRGIEAFSHLWLLFDFSKAHRPGFCPTVRPPRLGGNERVGVFASRSPFRPNSIGLSAVRLCRIEETAQEGQVLWVAGADLLSGTPIYDIKPYLPYADCLPEACGGYAERTQHYRLQVEAPPALLALLPAPKRDALLECLAEDPRPSYQEDPSRIYRLSFAGFTVAFSVSDGVLTVTDIFK